MKKILVIDDDAFIQTAVEAVLQGQPYTLAKAFDGVEGLEKVLEERPDMIILDVMMPKKNGFEVCKELKTDPRYYFFSKIPILLLTVYPGDRDKMNLSMREGLEMQADDYLQKPFEPSELVDRIERLLNNEKKS